MVFCFNRMTVNTIKPILFCVMILCAIITFSYLNNQRVNTIEQFFDSISDSTPPSKFDCTTDKIDFYTTQYITQSNLEYKDAYEKCMDYTSTVNLNLVSLVDPLVDLLTEHSRLSDSNSILQTSNDTLSNDLSASNGLKDDLDIEWSDLNSNNIDLNNTNSNLNSISNLLGTMDEYQGKINALSNLQNAITSQLCTEMSGNYGSNCGLKHIEELTKEKLKDILQSHIDIVPNLSEAYILAVKMWIAYEKGRGLIDRDSNMTEAINAYNRTMTTLNTAEESMYTVIQLYGLYENNFFYTIHGFSNADFTLSNQDSNINIRFASDGFSYSNTDSNYVKLFETCSSSNTISETNSNHYNVDASCTSSNYSEIIETISNCESRDTCIREQDSNVKSGLEYIYRAKFDRNFINTFTDTNTDSTYSTYKANVDKNIVQTFLHKVFNHNVTLP